MASIAFTKNLERHVACPSVSLPASTVQQLFDAYFAAHPGVRGYVLDERGALRKHMNVFVDGGQLVDRLRLSDALGPDSQVYVMQALSGG
jgi:molybdopterin synthase sulfur carrier subunit